MRVAQLCILSQPSFVIQPNFFLLILHFRPITLVVAKCWDPNPKGYFTLSRQEPVRPIDPRAWVLHTNAMTAGQEVGIHQNSNMGLPTQNSSFPSGMLSFVKLCWHETLTSMMLRAYHWPFDRFGESTGKSVHTQMLNLTFIGNYLVWLWWMCEWMNLALNPLSAIVKLTYIEYRSAWFNKCSDKTASRTFAEFRTLCNTWVCAQGPELNFENHSYVLVEEEEKEEMCFWGLQMHRLLGY